MTWLAIVAIHTAANEPPKVRQVMNKIHRNVGPASCPASCPASRPARCTALLVEGSVKRGCEVLRAHAAARGREPQIDLQVRLPE